MEILSAVLLLSALRYDSSFQAFICDVFRELLSCWAVSVAAYRAPKCASRFHAEVYHMFLKRFWPKFTRYFVPAYSFGVIALSWRYLIAVCQELFLRVLSICVRDCSPSSNPLPTQQHSSVETSDECTAWFRIAGFALHSLWRRFESSLQRAKQEQRRVQWLERINVIQCLAEQSQGPMQSPDAVFSILDRGFLYRPRESSWTFFERLHDEIRSVIVTGMVISASNQSALLNSLLDLRQGKARGLFCDLQAALTINEQKFNHDAQMHVYQGVIRKFWNTHSGEALGEAHEDALWNLSKSRQKQDTCTQREIIKHVAHFTSQQRNILKMSI